MKALSLIDRWPVAHPAAGVVTRNGRRWTHGDPAHVQPLASVSKLMLAWAVLVACEQRLLGLDDPVGPPGSTLRHLLAHASGLPFIGGTPILPPGRRRIYSNTGYDLAGRALAAATGAGMAESLRRLIFDSLGMSGCHLPDDGSPATDVHGDLEGVLAFAAELLAPRLIGADLYTLATSVVFPGLGGVLPGVGRFADNAWGLGVEIRDGKQPHWTGTTNSPATFGHFGGTGTFLWVDPVAGLACAALAERQFEDWGLEHWPDFSDAVLAERREIDSDPAVDRPR